MRFCEKKRFILTCVDAALIWCCICPLPPLHQELSDQRPQIAQLSGLQWVERQCLSVTGSPLCSSSAHWSARLRRRWDRLPQALSGALRAWSSCWSGIWADLWHYCQDPCTVWTNWVTSADSGLYSPLTHRRSMTKRVLAILLLYYLLRMMRGLLFMVMLWHPVLALYT